MSYLSYTDTKMTQSVANYEIKLIGHIYNNKESKVISDFSNLMLFKIKVP